MKYSQPIGSGRHELLLKVSNPLGHDYLMMTAIRTVFLLQGGYMRFDGGENRWRWHFRVVNPLFGLSNSCNELNTISKYPEAHQSVSSVQVH